MCVELVEPSDYVTRLEREVPCTVHCKITAVLELMPLSKIRDLVSLFNFGGFFLDSVVGLGSEKKSIPGPW